MSDSLLDFKIDHIQTKIDLFPLGAFVFLCDKHSAGGSQPFQCSLFEKVPGHLWDLKPLISS